MCSIEQHTTFGGTGDAVLAGGFGGCARYGSGASMSGVVDVDGGGAEVDSWIKHGQPQPAVHELAKRFQSISSFSAGLNLQYVLRTA